MPPFRPGTTLAAAASDIREPGSSTYCQCLPSATRRLWRVRHGSSSRGGDVSAYPQDRITPERAGILGGSRRRVPGLRREEVALLTGVSVEYYARMERGDLTGVSPEVLDSLSDALQLDDAETDHLHGLARAAGPRPVHRRQRTADQTIRPSLRRFLDAITGAPVWIRDRRMTIVTANALGRALYAPILDDPANQANTARFMFFNPAADTFFPDRDQGADEIVATLRSYAGRRPHDRGLTDLIGELVTRSDAFRMRWAKHNLRFHRLGIKWTCPRTRTGSCSVTPPHPVARPRNVSNFSAVSPSPARHPNADADLAPIAKGVLPVTPSIAMTNLTCRA